MSQAESPLKESPLKNPESLSVWSGFVTRHVLGVTKQKKGCLPEANSLGTE
jgi:hypothetical protein